MGAVGTATFPVWGSTAVVVTADPGALDSAAGEVRRTIDEIDDACNRFRADSEISLVNAAGGAWVRVGPVFLGALGVALDAARATGGAVDPTVGEALVRIGYDRDFAAIAPSGPALSLPSEPAPGWGLVDVDVIGSRVRAPTGVRLDLGATAKALAADRAAERAAATAGCGVMVSLGGDLAVAGEPPRGAWKVSIADDHAATGAPDETIAIASGGVATSSTTVRRWVRGGAAVHHVIDPRTGLPAREVWRTVSVAAATCVAANIASTLSIVRGEDAPAWLEFHGLPARLVRVDGRVVHAAGWPESEAGAA